MTESELKLDNPHDYFLALQSEILNDPIVAAWFQNYQHKGLPLINCLIGTIKSLSETKRELFDRQIEYINHYGVLPWNKHGGKDE